MFIIVGNNKQAQQVKIFDTTDNTCEWYDYDFMNKGIELGIEVRGINSEGIIKCKQVNILKELEDLISEPVHSYRVYNTPESLLEYLQAYGLADSISDIVIKDDTIRIKRLGKDIKLKTYAMSDEFIKKAEARVLLDKESSNTGELNKVTISCVCATYLDSDDTVNKVSIFVKHLEDKDEIKQLLEDKGNIGVEIYEFEERTVTPTELEHLKIGDVVEVYETTKEDEEAYADWLNEE